MGEFRSNKPKYMCKVRVSAVVVIERECVAECFYLGHSFVRWTQVCHVTYTFPQSKSDPGSSASRRSSQANHLSQNHEFSPQISPSLLSGGGSTCARYLSQDVTESSLVLRPAYCPCQATKPQPLPAMMNASTSDLSWVQKVNRLVVGNTAPDCRSEACLRSAQGW